MLAHWTAAVLPKPRVNTLRVESVEARQCHLLLALAEVLDADGARFVLGCGVGGLFGRDLVDGQCTDQPSGCGDHRIRLVLLLLLLLCTKLCTNDVLKHPPLHVRRQRRVHHPSEGDFGVAVRLDAQPRQGGLQPRGAVREWVHALRLVGFAALVFLHVATEHEAEDRSEDETKRHAPVEIHAHENDLLQHAPDAGTTARAQANQRSATHAAQPLRLISAGHAKSLLRQRQQCHHG
mmetsp:Transcript_74531/g.241135  ORF Transcript_74531/g.241135 Transcript_74531/m.241135 type:complete len:236 (+) Transcript_74531:516-1223(+)